MRQPCVLLVRLGPFGRLQHPLQPEGGNIAFSERLVRVLGQFVFHTGLALSSVQVTVLMVGSLAAARMR